MSTQMKMLVALNVATLVAVVLLGTFVVLTVNDTHQKVASIAAALPAGGVASSADVQDLTAANQATSQAITDLTTQVAALSTTLGAMQTELTTIAGAAASPVPGTTPAPDSTIGKLMAAVETLQSTVTHIQDDVAKVQSFAQTICSALGRC
jgi:hypothetical protein